jgi:hypothetical protein
MVDRTRLEAVGPTGANDAADGYRRMGSAEFAGLIDEAVAFASPGVGDDGRFDPLELDDETSEALDARDERPPDDSDLKVLFKGYLAAHTDQFEPL